MNQNFDLYCGKKLNSFVFGIKIGGRMWFTGGINYQLRVLQYKWVKSMIVSRKYKSTWLLPKAYFLPTCNHCQPTRTFVCLYRSNVWFVQSAENRCKTTRTKHLVNIPWYSKSSFWLRKMAQPTYSGAVFIHLLSTLLKRSPGCYRRRNVHRYPVF